MKRSKNVIRPIEMFDMLGEHLAKINKLASLAVAVDSQRAVSDLDQIKDCIQNAPHRF
jgi:hypothetical protein